MYQLLSCGSNGNYQLGINNDEDQNTLQPSIFNTQTQIPHKPVKIVCGGNHTLVLLETGEVYSCGDNTYGQCGVPKSIDKLKVFTKVPGDDWVDISCGWEFSILVKRDGQVFVCGNGLKGELGLGKNIKQTELVYSFTVEKFLNVISCMQHTIIQNSDQKLVGWGNCRKGQLGKTTEKVFWEPTTLDFGQPVQKYCLGREFTVIQSDSDTVTIFGKSSITEIPKMPISEFAAMWSSVHVLSGGTIHSFGNNSHDQLFPTTNIPIDGFAIGSEHGLIKSGNSVYAWGWSEHGNCGASTTPNSKTTFDYLNKLYTGDEEVVLISGGCATSWVVVRNLIEEH
ncbi:SPAC10F6.04 RCC1 repeat-containing protein C10F6.04 [Candida maltosa Xu316]|uniref:RCC1-like domain-containing protein n=1 Tax=Candida maltosa (strain Xu316) TaxID=1245528 RepID=M3K0E9_CANMX|nr:Putative uncharacterized protein ATS1 [Candida maltosa Xu316]